MKTLYDLLGAHPSDNAAALRSAFRKAAKANHPDLHAGDRDAAMRFREIADAYEVLRDAERRATYDGLLRFERERVAWKSKSTASYPMRSVVSHAAIALGLAIVLGGGYKTYAHFSRTPVEELAGTGGRESARTAVVQPAEPTNTNKPDERPEGPNPSAGPELVVPDAGVSAATHDLASEPALGGPVPGAAGLNAEVANITNAFAVTSVRTDPKSAAEHPGPQLVKVLASSGQRDSDGDKPSSSDFALPGDKRDMKRRETRDINASGAKISDTKLPARTAAKRQAAGRTEFEQRQAAGRTELEQRQAAGPTESEQRQAAGHTEFDQASLPDRNACSGSCARDVRPILGVGF
jgi:hypothetical protein